MIKHLDLILSMSLMTVIVLFCELLLNEGVKPVVVFPVFIILSLISFVLLTSSVS